MPAAAVKAHLLSVKFVEVLQDARDFNAFVLVELMLEQTSRDRESVEHEVLADESAGVGKTARKLVRLRHQKQARCFCAVAGDDDGFSMLQALLAALVEIDSAHGTALRVELDLAHVAVRANLASTCGDGLWNHRRQRAGFGTHFASETGAESAVGARQAPW